MSEENLPDRTRDEYSLSVCPNPIEKLIEETFREASSTVTVNERDWMQETGILDKIDSLADTDWEAWATKKAQNQFKLWQRSMDPWTAECSSNQIFKDSADEIDKALKEGKFETYLDINDLMGTARIIWIVKFVLLLLAAIILFTQSLTKPMKQLRCIFITFVIVTVTV